MDTTRCHIRPLGKAESRLRTTELTGVRLRAVLHLLQTNSDHERGNGTMESKYRTKVAQFSRKVRKWEATCEPTTQRARIAPISGSATRNKHHTSTSQGQRMLQPPFFARWALRNGGTSFSSCQQLAHRSNRLPTALGHALPSAQPWPARAGMARHSTTFPPWTGTEWKPAAEQVTKVGCWGAHGGACCTRGFGRVEYIIPKVLHGQP